MNNLFLIEVLRKNRMLFILFCLFVFGQVYFMKIRIHNFPFFIYDMYSRPIEHRGGSTSIYEFYINGKRWNISNLNQYEQAVVIGGINSYIRLKSEKKDYWEEAALKNLSFIPMDKNRIFNTEANPISHGEWLKRYIEKISKDDIRRLIVNQANYKCLSKNVFEVKNLKTVYQYPQ